MSNLKDRLIRLGSKQPDLRDDIRPVLDHLTKSSSMKGVGDYFQAPEMRPKEVIDILKETKLEARYEWKDDYQQMIDMVKARNFTGALRTWQECNSFVRLPGEVLQYLDFLAQAQVELTKW